MFGAKSTTKGETGALGRNTILHIESQCLISMFFGTRLVMFEEGSDKNQVE